MPIIGHTRKAGARSPQPVTGINWASPLAEGLTHAWMPSAGSAKRLEDLAGSSPLTGTGTLGASELGQVLVFDGSTNDASASVPIGSAGLSIALWNLRAGIAAFRDICGFSSGVFDYIALENGTSSNWHVYARTTAVANDALLNSTKSVSIVPAHLVVTIDDLNAGTARVYHNGIKVGADDPLSGDYRNLTSNFGVGWGGSGRGTSRRGACAVTGIMVYDRAISAAEVAALYNPGTRWDWIRQPARTYFIPAAAGGGFQPAWAARSTITISGGMTR